MFERYAFDHHYQLAPFDNAANLAIIERWQLNAPCFKAFVIYNKTPVFPMQELYKVSLLVKKYIYITIYRVHMYLPTNYAT